MAKVDIFQSRYLNGDYLKSRTSSKKMHLTLFTLMIEEDEVERAKSLFKNCNLDMTLSSSSLLQLGPISQFGKKLLLLS